MLSFTGIAVFIFCGFFTNGLRLLQHPLEKRIMYVYDIKDINKIDKYTMNSLHELFQKHPLLIFKDVYNVSPREFLRFVKQFDVDCDEAALNNPEEYQEQMLQPFDQFPDCKHVAPRGNVELSNFHNIKNIQIKPYDAFINNYVWHTDMLGHEYKLLNVVTGFYIIDSPLIGGDTDFISGETIYENLNTEEQFAAQNILIEINRRKFVTNMLQTDYAGVNRLEPFEEMETGKTTIPLVFAPDSEYEKPRILIMPTFFEKVVGWTVKESRQWMQSFMNKHVLPHRVSVQWKTGDLAVFNNRRFIHSSNPARNYMDNADSNKRLLLQTFIPTNRPLLGIKPLNNKVYACYNVKWMKDQEKSIISAHDYLKFAIQKSLKQNETCDPKYYIFASKPIHK